MGILDTLAWLWDPRDKDQKAYDAWNKTEPLQRHTQELDVYIVGIEQPFKRVLTFEDFEIGGIFDTMRVNLDDEVSQWLARRGRNGVKIDDVWYSPSQIERIELGKKTVESIK